MPNLPILNRIKVIKDLFLEKLDHLYSKSALVDSKLDHLHSKSALVDSKLDHLHSKSEITEYNTSIVLKNDVSLLQSAIDTAKSIQYLDKESQKRDQLLSESMQDLKKESQKQYQLLSENIQHLDEESQKQYQLLADTLNNIYEGINQQKVKIIIDNTTSENIEIQLMTYLYSYLSDRCAIDIGANRGDVSSRLLETGYEVYAFEPFTSVFEKLTNRLGNNPNFHAFPLALGSTNETKDLHIASDQTNTKLYDDSTFYSSLTKHSLAEGLVFTDTLPVTVTTLKDLHDSAKIPTKIGLVKIDTEGFDLEVIKGMGSYRYPVVVAEFWDIKCPFGEFGAMNKLEDMVKEMKTRNYHWYIVIYRIWGVYDVSYYCNSAYSLEKSWGNVFFFQDHHIFSQALTWCSSVMRPTYFGY